MGEGGERKRERERQKITRCEFVCVKFAVQKKWTEEVWGGGGGGGGGGGEEGRPSAGGKKKYQSFPPSSDYSGNSYLLYINISSLKIYLKTYYIVLLLKKEQCWEFSYPPHPPTPTPRQLRYSVCERRWNVMPERRPTSRSIRIPSAENNFHCRCSHRCGGCWVRRSESLLINRGLMWTSYYIAGNTLQKVVK